ncbi:MAG: hypothetical protein ACTHOI_05480 [Sphingomicrobium sp.]
MGWWFGRKSAPADARPFVPAWLRNEAAEVGLSWTRRSRKGFAWTDEIDAPLGESTEQYRVTLAGAQGSAEFDVGEPELVIAATVLAEIGTGPITIEVRQVGDAAASRPATAFLTI